MKYHCLKICLTHVVEEKVVSMGNQKMAPKETKRKEGFGGFFVEVFGASWEPTEKGPREPFTAFGLFGFLDLRIEEERKKQGRTGGTKEEFDEVGTEREKRFCVRLRDQSGNDPAAERFAESTWDGEREKEREGCKGGTTK